MSDSIRAEMVGILPRLRRYAYALTGNLHDADDIVQETCLRALARLDQWQRGTRLDSWMYRIAQNIYFDRCRAAKVRGETVDLDEAYELMSVDGRQEMENRLSLGEALVGIAQLPQEQRSLITLVCINGLSYKEAAQVAEIPLGTVMSRLARARIALHEHISKSEPQVSSSKVRGHL